jgi:hypothetical protein
VTDTEGVPPQAVAGVAGTAVPAAACVPLLAGRGAWVAPLADELPEE